jgi:hypothetical protein
VWQRVAAARLALVAVVVEERHSMVWWAKNQTNRWFREPYKKGATPVAQKMYLSLPPACLLSGLLLDLPRPFYIYTLIQQLRFSFAGNAPGNAWSQQAHACMLSHNRHVFHLYGIDYSLLSRDSANVAGWGYRAFFGQPV